MTFGVDQERPTKSVETQFGGVRGNPQGATSEQRKLEIENAAIATRVRNKLMSALERAIEQTGEEDVTKALKLMNANAVKFIRDSEDRGLGAPKQEIHIPGVSDLGMTIVPGMTLAQAQDQYQKLLDGKV